MSKQIFIDPNVVRKPETLSFPSIPVNQYQKTVKDEKKNFTKEEFLNIYRDMAYIREFETMTTPPSIWPSSEMGLTA